MNLFRIPRFRRLGPALLTVLGSALHPAAAWEWPSLDDGKLANTAPMTSLDGASGGLITTSALIAGNETREGYNADLHYTYVHLPNFDLQSVGVAVGLFDRYELSASGLQVTTGNTYSAAGADGEFEWNPRIGLATIGAKVRVYGDAVYDTDNLIPQIAIGANYKDNSNTRLIADLGAYKQKDYEVYASATKFIYPLSLLLSVTTRYTNANEDGLAGFGGLTRNGHRIRFEGSAAYLIDQNLRVGVEVQQHNRNLDGVTATVDNVRFEQTDDDAWADLFFTYLPSRHLSLSLGVTEFGEVLGAPRQTGFFSSVQVGF